MDTKERCQSCGMPLGDGFYGTNADGSTNTDYCKYCFRDGAFTQPNQTREEMIQSSIKHMTEDEHMPEDQASKLANDTIPNLGRWRE